MATRPFRDRREAGIALGEHLASSNLEIEDGIVLGLPRGGVPVAARVADALGLPLDVFVVRKLGVPGHAELAMGAIASGGVRIINDDLVRQLHIGGDDIARVEAREREELERRERTYRGDREPLRLTGRTVFVVDDGIATGASMMAAVEAIRAEDPASVIVAVPVAARDSVETFRRAADECVALRVPEPFMAVGYWYVDFGQTTDGQVRELVAASG